MKSFPLALLLAPFLHGQIQFEPRTLAEDLKGGYQTVIADLNKDGRPDVIALASGMKDLYWFENPTWERHVLASGLNRMINAAVLDSGILVAHEFANVPRNSLGVVSLLESGPDPRQPWKVREIDRLPTSHRLRVIRLDRTVRGIVNAPLANPTAEPPDYRGGVPVVLYRDGAWKREPVDSQTEGVMHGLSVMDWDGDGRDEILTASFEGLHLLSAGRGGQWTARKLSAGDPTPWPKGGSSEIAVGRLGKQRFLAAIEPWHGDKVVVYHPKGKNWERQVIDSGELDGHTLVLADLDGDGFEEVIAGFRGPGRSIFYYRYSKEEKAWKKHAVDKGGIAAAGCAAADLDGDGRTDLACIGSATANLKLYRNLGLSR